VTTPVSSSDGNKTFRAGRESARRGPARLAVLEEVQTRFAAAGAVLDVHLSQFPGHAEELARTLGLRGYDGFCLIGGDGTIHEVANGLLQRGDGVSIPLGIIPGVRATRCCCTWAAQPPRTRPIGS